MITAGHTHTDACYTVETVAGTEVKTLACGLAETPDVTEEVPDTEAEPISWVCGAEVLVCEHSTCTTEACAAAQSTPGAEAATPQETPQGAPQQSPRAGGTGLITVTAASSTSNYRTWTDPSNQVAPTELVVTLTVTLTQPDIAGGTIELPLSYFPTAASFTQWDDFFVFDGSSLDGYIADPNSMLEKYEVVGDNNAAGQNEDADLKLVLYISEGQPAGREDISLRFAYNQAAYLTSTGLGKVPSGTTLWEFQPSAFVGGVLSDVDESGAVKTSAATSLSPFTTYFVPTGEAYSGGMVTNRAGITNYNYFQHDFDPNATSIVYFDLPTGSTGGHMIAGSAFLLYFNKTIDHDDGALGAGLASGNTRYYREVNNNQTANWNSGTNPGAAWTGWHTNGNTNDVKTNFDLQFTPPASLQVEGAAFSVTTGAIYTKVNGETVAVNSTKNYVYHTPRDGWDLYLTTYHSTGDFPLPRCGINNGDVGSRVVRTSWSDYVNSLTTKNQGTTDVGGVQMVLTQPTTGGSAKLAFNYIRISASRATATDAYAQYRVEFEIKNARDGTVRTVDDDKLYIPSTGVAHSVNVDLPDLDPGEYIDKVYVIPMGTTGDQEGVLPPQKRP